MTSKTILLSEDDSGIRMVISQALASEGFTVRATASPETLEKWVRAGEGDAVISDVYLGDESIFDRLPSLRLARPDLPFIVMSAQSTILTAASAEKQGAFDYLPKPFDVAALIDTVRRATRSASKRAAITPQSRRSLADAGLPMVGRSDAMQAVYRTITRVMDTPLTVLIEGETGTGKALAAHAIHDLSRTAERPFHEIIAHEIAGALADPERAGPGRTLHIADVGAADGPSQALLVRYLRSESRARVIASTRLPLAGEGEGALRADLALLLSTVRLVLPPLRTRRDDIPEIAEALLVRAARLGLRERAIDPAAMDLLVRHDWPGNVRELETLILRLCALGDTDPVGPAEVREALASDVVAAPREEEGFEQDLAALLRTHVGPQLSRPGPEGSSVFQDTINAVERPLISLALGITNGNKVRAAALLGVNRNTLRAKMTSLGLADD